MPVKRKVSKRAEQIGVALAKRSFALASTDPEEDDTPDDWENWLPEV